MNWDTNKGENEKKRKKTVNRIKWIFIWIIIHSLSLSILTFSLNFLNIKNGLFQLFFIGLGVTIFANIARIYTIRKKFIVDKWFLFWSLINTTTIWIFFVGLNYFQVMNFFIRILITAIGLVFIVYFVKKFLITNTKLWVSVIIIFLILVYIQNSNQHNLVQNNSMKIDDNTAVKSGNVFKDLIQFN